MAIRHISLTRIFVSTTVFFVLVLCGILNSMNGGTWAIMMSKDNRFPMSLIGLVVSTLSMAGKATNHIGFFATIGRYPYYNPFFFWLGQLAFSAFLSIAIIKLPSRDNQRKK